jgi:hypothetical protein
VLFIMANMFPTICIISKGLVYISTRIFIELKRAEKSYWKFYSSDLQAVYTGGHFTLSHNLNFGVFYNCLDLTILIYEF